LSTPELLSLLGISLPDAYHMLAVVGGVEGLARATLEELAALPGIGPALAGRIKAALTLGRRLAQTGDRGAPLRSPADMYYTLFQEMSYLDQEELWVAALDARLRPVKVVPLYRGSAVGIQTVKAAEVLSVPIRAFAPNCVIAHNHPSGDPSPSPEDISVTTDLVKAARLMDLDLLDHIIVGGHDRFISLRERTRAWRLGLE